MRRLEISRSGIDRILAHTVADLPAESCGVLLGRDRPAGRRVSGVVAARNVASEPRTGFTIAPEDLVAASRQARETGLEVVGYYHSHPDGGAVPSGRDRAAAWPGVSYLIVATAGRSPGEMRSWRLAESGFEEESVHVVGSAGLARAEAAG